MRSGMVYLLSCPLICTRNLKLGFGVTLSIRRYVMMGGKYGHQKEKLSN